MKNKWNFIFFMPDEMRAESLGCYGHPLVKTPNFDKLAEEGTRFDYCYVQHPVCGPSRCSMMSGWYPHNTGCRTNEFFLHPHQPSLFKYLKQAGYHIEWHGKNDLYSQDYFLQAVTRSNVETRDNKCLEDEKLDFFTGEPYFPFGEPGYYSFLRKPTKTAPENSGDYRHVERGMSFLRSRSYNDDPFLLYLPLGCPHPPYCASEQFYNMYNPEDIPGLRAKEHGGNNKNQQLFQNYHELEGLSEDIFRKINAVYLGMISYSDWMFGQLLNTLEETGLADNTIIFVFSDHGDYAGDYGLVHKFNNGLEDVMLRVPLIVKMPGQVQNHVVKEPVELFDIMATVLDIADVETEHPHFAQSLLEQLDGKSGDSDRIVFAEGGFSERQKHCMCFNYQDGLLIKNPENPYHAQAQLHYDHPEVLCRSTMIRTSKYKLNYRPEGESELYNMMDDPREINNLYQKAEYSSVKNQLEKRLLDWIIETSDVTPYKKDSRKTPRIKQS